MLETALPLAIRCTPAVYDRFLVITQGMIIAVNLRENVETRSLLLFKRGCLIILKNNVR
jgi:hypothetical protein